MDVEELKRRLQERANLSPEQAEAAAKVALEFVAEHVPQASDLLDKGGGVEGVAGRLGELFKR